MNRERWRRVLGVAQAVASQIWRLLVFCARVLFVVWIQLPRKARFAMLLATLVVLAAETSSIPAISSTFHGVAVLLVAALGFWLIVHVPFRRRRF